MMRDHFDYIVCSVSLGLQLPGALRCITFWNIFNVIIALQFYIVIVYQTDAELQLALIHYKFDQYFHTQKSFYKYTRVIWMHRPDYSKCVCVVSVTLRCGQRGWRRRRVGPAPRAPWMTWSPRSTSRPETAGGCRPRSPPRASSGACRDSSAGRSSGRSDDTETASLYYGCSSHAAAS